ncbi:uncharacterized protein LOC135181183 [Pogoniulus pusillus]|uniref:uncharacterized protein LOC135181183 n=1 Tax=Pogoniulus pusillus TaxID=488313 RepID=UPI0030B96980
MRGERSRKNGGREQGKERGREGERERRKEGREREREGGESLAPRSLSPSLARSVPLPYRLRSPRRDPLRLTGGGRCSGGGGEGGAFRDRGGGRKEGGVCPSDLTGSGCYQRQVRMQIASCLWGTGHEAGGFNCPGSAKGFCRRVEPQLSGKRRRGERAMELRDRQAADTSPPAPHTEPTGVSPRGERGGEGGGWRSWSRSGGLRGRRRCLLGRAQLSAVLRPPAPACRSLRVTGSAGPAVIARSHSEVTKGSMAGANSDDQR